MTVQGVTRQALGEVTNNSHASQQQPFASPQKKGLATPPAGSPAKKNDHKAALFNSPQKSTALPEPLLDENSDRCACALRARVCVCAERSLQTVRA